jgi:hypothetical protein
MGYLLGKIFCPFGKKQKKGGMTAELSFPLKLTTLPSRFLWCTSRPDNPDKYKLNRDKDILKILSCLQYPLRGGITREEFLRY